MKKEIQILEQRKLLGKQFRIYGTLGEPLFLAKDVADMIDHSNVSKMLSNIDDDEKQLIQVGTLTNSYAAWFLTEDGLYEVLMQSRKPIAKQFKKGVKNILKQIRKTGEYTVNKISEEDKKWLELKRAEQDENAQYLINYYRRKDKAQFEQILIEERDGEEKHITLTEMAEILSEKLGIKVISVDITDFLVHKGYFTLRYFQAMSNGKLRYYYDGSPRIEERPHRQPTEIFIQDVCKQGYAASKKPDERGKITVTAYFVKFIDWFLDNHGKDFLKYMKYNKKGFEV